MRRDMDLIRSILMACEMTPAGRHLCASDITVGDATRDSIVQHAVLLLEEQLLVGRHLTALSLDDEDVVIQRLTWQGHDFIAAARDEATWQAGKTAAKKVGDVSFSVLKEILSAFAKERLGLPG